MNTKLIAKIHVLLKQTGLTAYKADIVSGISSKGSESLKDLSKMELVAVANYLEKQPKTSLTQIEQDEKTRLIRTLVGLCYQVDKLNENLCLVAMGKPNYTVIGKHLDKQVGQSNLNKMNVDQLKKGIQYFKILIKNYGKH
ncbi:MAG: hypothetical protein K2Q03_04985 [Sphingobacteriaceae bacterium]|nr:hypothetical protein [Sphingobacteriaceae bacterium]